MSSSKGENDCHRKDTQELLEIIEAIILPEDRQKFDLSEAERDWEEATHERVSGKGGKLLQISMPFGKCHPLEEFTSEAPKDSKKPSKKEPHKRHPDLPKRPLSAFIRFFKEQRPQYVQMYPNLKNQELTKIMAENFKSLPEEMKLKYIQAFQNDKREYEEKMALFRVSNPQLCPNPKKPRLSKSRPSTAPKKILGQAPALQCAPEKDSSHKMRFPGEPQKPPMNAYHKFHMDLWSSRELQAMPVRARWVEVSRRWQRVPQSQREQYEAQAVELQKQYFVARDLWLKSLSPEDYAAYKETSRAKGKPWGMTSGPPPEISWTQVQSPAARSLQEGLAQEKSPERKHSVQASGDELPAPRAEAENRENGPREEGIGDSQEDAEARGCWLASLSSTDTSSDSDSS